MFRRLPFLMAALLFVDFLDEFSAGMAPVGIPGIEETFALTYTVAAFFVFTAPTLLAFLLEPPLFVLADRFPKKGFIVAGFLGMAVLDLTIGLANAFWLVAAALTLAGVASGCGVSLSQAALMDAYPEDRERSMTRWTLMGTFGDLAAPALFWLLALFTLGWRAAFVTTGLVLLGYAFLLWRTDFGAARRVSAPARGGEAQEPAEEAEAAAEETPPLREILRAAFANRRLMLWLLGVWLCGMLDELLVAFGALWLRDHLGADQATRSAILMCMMTGGIFGLLLLERVLARLGPLLALKIAGLLAAVAYAAWLAAATATQSGIAMFFVGLFSFPLYPIAKAQAYRALPERSGMVNAMSHVFTPLDVLLPLLLGIVADRFGLLPALAVLVLEPLGLAAIAFFAPGPRPQASRIG